VVVFVASVLGFGIAFYGLFHKEVTQFSTVPYTVRTLLDAALGQHEFDIFSKKKNEFVGSMLFAIYILFSMLILMNLIIAKMSVSRCVVEIYSCLY